MFRISSLTEKGFKYHALPQGLQMLDNRLTIQLEGVAEEINARLSFSFQSREWTIDQVVEIGAHIHKEWTASKLTEEIERIFECQPELLEEGMRLIGRIDEMNQMDEEEFEAACERGEFEDIIM
ncbi:hypothetical protein SAMN05216378_0506 [Paenibacillus catalpae]|uniref:Uncharacterized protein n=1 Tax=Paenibacillus catalpae TaxID=1045775 RepID=A0A1I1TN35_9BACL|nr:hypothetical protein [Paenibacillus catalpae]SFD57873.1 hypothetical protein SAMN05216378_0506 [Paenibacillus catalpae]